MSTGKKSSWIWLVVFVLGAVLAGIEARERLRPRTISLNVPALTAVGRPTEFAASAVDRTGREITRFNWSIRRSSIRVASSDQRTMTFTPSESGSYQVRLTVTGSLGSSTSAEKTISVCTPSEFDNQLTEWLIGQWREEAEQGSAVFRLAEGGQFNASLRLNPDRAPPNFPEGLDRFNGKWWVKDEMLHMEFTGAESSRGTAMESIGTIIKKLLGYPVSASSAGKIISCDKDRLVLDDPATQKRIVWYGAN